MEFDGHFSLTNRYVAHARESRVVDLELCFTQIVYLVFKRSVAYVFDMMLIYVPSAFLRHAS